MSTFTPNEVPGAGLHRQLGMLEETGILGGVPRRQASRRRGSRSARRLGSAA
jgi:hypothetical protein